MKKKTNKPETFVDHTVVYDRNMEEVMHDSMIPYSEHVILERAIPRVEDGLKPVQRRVLYTMYEQGLTPDKPFRKSANIVGECMAKYHPHGDSSIYETMVRLAQDFNMRTPLVEGNGNFGSMDGDSPAAFRYTEARLAMPAMEMMATLDRDTVSWSLNFDDTRKEPDVLPTNFPNLLINGSYGIAVGFNTNIPTHHPVEVIDGVIAYLTHPRITLEEMMKIIPGPDFPTGGIIVNGEALPEIYRTGSGKLTLRARAGVETSADGHPMIVITEFPYGANKAELLAKILEIAQNRKEIVAQILDIRDESDRTGVRSVIELIEGCDAAKMLAYLYKYTDLQKTVPVNMIAIAQGKPRTLGLLDMIRYYTQFRCEVERRRVTYDLGHAEAREEILVGLSVAAQNIDRVIAIIRGSRTPAIAREGLMSAFSLTENQANAILEMKLRRITGLEVETIENELRDVRALIAECRAILASKTRLHTVIKKSMEKMKSALDTPRRTEILYDQVEENIDRNAFKTVEETVIFVDEKGSLHRMSPKMFDSYQKNAPSVPQEKVALTHTDKSVLLFGGKGMCYILKAEDVPNAKKVKEKGVIPEKILANFDDRTVLAVYAIGEDPAKDELIFATSQGQVKVSPATEYAIRRNKFDAMSLREDDRLLYVGVRREGAKLVYVTDSGKEKVFRQPVEPTARKTKGVRAVKGTFVRVMQV